MSRRPPVAPTQKFKLKSEEEKDTVGELGEAMPPMRRGVDYSPLNWDSCWTRQEWLGQIPLYWSGETGPVFVFMHGAGHSAMSFAKAAQLLTGARAVAFDFRGHGNNSQEDPYKLEAQTLVQDSLAVLQHIKSQTGDSPVVLVGHSMGGAIASKTGAAFQNSGGSLEGIIVLDVVEGSAIDALPHMDSIVRQRPRSFKSLEAAIQWHVESGTIKNLESARISVPYLMTQQGSQWVWKTNLMRTKPYWEDWFRGMNDAFLSIEGAKQLMLAGSERIDKQMMIAQMQGKYKHTVVSDVGHVIQEDNPERFASELQAFIDTFRINTC